jgi:hypothetical protein
MGPSPAQIFFGPRAIDDLTRHGDVTPRLSMASNCSNNLSIALARGQLLPERPDRAGVRNTLLQPQSQEPDKRRPGIDEKFGASIGQIVSRLDDKDLKLYVQVQVIEGYIVLLGQLTADDDVGRMFGAKTRASSRWSRGARRNGTSTKRFLGQIKASEHRFDASIDFGCSRVALV